MNPYVSVFEIYEDNKVLKERMIPEMRTMRLKY